MRSPPAFARFLCLLCLLCLCLLSFGCASTSQTMQPPTGELTISVGGTPDNPAARQGPIVVIVGAQIGVTAKPVGLDILNPAASIAAQQNSGTADSVATAGNVAVDKEAPGANIGRGGPAKAAAEQTESNAVETDLDTHPVAAEQATGKNTEDQPAAPSGGG